MTLKRSSRVSDTLMGSISKNRTWAMALLALFTFLWFGVSELISLNSVKYAIMDQTLTGRLQHTAMTFLGLGSYSFPLVCGFALILGMQGFAFLYDSKKVDFYFSQPIKRRTRFAAIYLNGILHFAVIYGLGMILGLIIACAMGGFSGVLIPTMLLEFVNEFVLFLSLYSITILATLLCGNLFAGFCSVGFFWLAEIVIRVMIWALCEVFFTTWHDNANIERLMTNGITTPILNHIAGMAEGGMGGMASSANIDFKAFSEAVAAFLPEMGKNILIAIVFCALSYFAFEKRRAEYAGRSVVYPFMENVYKWVVALVAGTGFGMIVGTIMGEMESSPRLNITSFSTVFAICVGVFVVCVISEGLFAMNVKKVFRRFWHMPIIAFLCLVVFWSFDNDWFGYDSYMPNASSLSSVTMWPSYDMTGSENYRKYNEDNSNSMLYGVEGYITDNVKAADMESALQIALLGQQNIRAQKHDGAGEKGTDMLVCYDLKNGKQIYRSINVPYSVDKDLMDAIITPDDYAEAVNGYSGAVYALEKIQGKRELYANDFTGEDREIGKAEDVEEFLKYYKEDIDEKFDYSLAASSIPIANVSLTLSVDTGGHYGDVYNFYFPVYKEYAGTVKYLENKGMDLSEENFRKKIMAKAKSGTISVSGYMSVINEDDSEPSEGYVSMEYTEPDKIEAIVKNVVRGDITTQAPFMKPDLLGYDGLVVSIYIDEYYGGSIDFRLDESKAPEFLMEDLKKGYDQ